MTPEAITQTLFHAGVDGSRHFADSEYALPELSYLVGEFTSWWVHALKRRGLGEWVEQWDCDDFAWTFYTDIRWAHRVTRRSMKEGIAVGVMYYMAMSRDEDGSYGGHAINVAITDEGPIFLEPQRAAIGDNPVIQLSEHELRSAWFVNF